MREGKYKTNIKPPYWECKSCGYRGPYYDFEKGMWWWLTYRCPKCKSEEFEDAKRPKIAPAPQKSKNINTKSKTTNMWIDQYLKDLKQNRYALKKIGLYIGQIKIFTEVLIKELENTYDYEEDD